MKRILCALIALFTFITYQSNAQVVAVEIGSAIGNIGDVVDVPVEVYLPAGSQGITVCQGAIVSSDPSKAEIVGFTIPSLPQLPGIAFDAFLINSGAVNFSGSSPQTPFNFTNNLMITLHVEIKAPDCATFSLSNLENASGGYIGSVQFVLDGVNGPILDDLANDFDVTPGQVCVAPQCAVPPTGLDCNLVFGKNGGHQTLSWTPIANAISYEIEIGYDDQECCSSGTLVNPNRVRIFLGSATSYNHPNNFKCFSFKVRAKCEDGSTSDWSEPECSCGPVQVSGPGPQKSLSQSGGVFVGFDLYVIPNPAVDYIDISVTSVLSDVQEEVVDMLIYDMSGKQIYTSSLSLDETKRVDLSSFNSGMYVVQIASNGTVLSTKKLIVE